MQRTLYSPDGQKYVATSPREVTRLESAGYSTKAPKGASTRPKPDEDAKPTK